MLKTPLFWHWAGVRFLGSLIFLHSPTIPTYIMGLLLHNECIRALPSFLIHPPLWNCPTNQSCHTVLRSHNCTIECYFKCKGEGSLELLWASICPYVMCGLEWVGVCRGSWGKVDVSESGMSLGREFYLTMCAFFSLFLLVVFHSLSIFSFSTLVPSLSVELLSSPFPQTLRAMKHQTPSYFLDSS